MINEYQMRMLPQQAANEASMREFIAREKGIDARTIKHVRVLRRSIDALSLIHISEPTRQYS